ncbi:TauD/TfdA family dioxygenase [Pseudomonas sp. S09G 359]|uniref:TauD/TfdA family dioxygenase n=1 Tax=Pseudomonas sp. S09G 359 TaxID=2054919 RepID=UPI002113B57E|nr:TauD/TfdA family dioxygenase [Pseudomonas sp. S09G 359]
MNINVSSFRQEASKVRLSKNAFDELLNAQEIIESDTRNGRFDIKPAYVNPLLLPVLSEELHRIRNMIDHESHVLILDGFKVEKLASFKSLVWTFGSLLGVPMVQNHLGHKVIEVYDRGGKSIEDGARYHQTRQGAYVHNDGVSDPLPIDYLILACGQKALLGGESILIDASAVYAELMAFPEILEELKCDFFLRIAACQMRKNCLKHPF